MHPSLNWNSLKWIDLYRAFLTASSNCYLKKKSARPSNAHSCDDDFKFEKCLTCLFLFEHEKSKLRISLLHYALETVVLAEQSQGHIYWYKCCLFLLLSPSSQSTLLFLCYWHFFNFVFCNRFILFQSVISVFPLAFPFWFSSQSLCCNLPTNFVRLALGKNVFSSRDQYTHFCHRLMIYVKTQREHCSPTRNKLLPMPLSFLSIYSLPVLHYKLVLYLLGAININNIEIVFKNTPTF